MKTGSYSSFLDGRLLRRAIPAQRVAVSKMYSRKIVSGRIYASQFELLSRCLLGKKLTTETKYATFPENDTRRAIASITRHIVRYAHMHSDYSPS